MSPLNDLRVLDLAWAVAGPLIGRCLADYGATVIRVESTQRLCTARMMGPFPAGKTDPQQSGLFENCNAGKLGMTIDLSREEGREIVRELVREWADVVIESFSPGQMASWGMGYEDLRALRPDLLMVSTSLMGQTGPWSGFAGFGNVGAAISGYQAIVGWPGVLPVGPFGPYTDFIGPRFSIVTLLSALDHRRRTGEGGWIDIAQAEAGVQFLAPQLARCAATGVIVTPQGNRDEQMAPHGVFACQPTAPNEEGWVSIAVRSDREWQRLAALIGGADLAHDARYATLQLRKADEDALEDLVRAWTAMRPAQEIETALQAIGVPVHNVASTYDMARDPQLQQRGHFVRMPHPLMEQSTFESTRYRLSETPAETARVAPHFGRDNAHVLSTMLGYTPERIAALGEAGLLR